MSLQKFTLYRDSKGTIWRDCFDPKKTELKILAKSEKQAFKLAYDNIQYDKFRGWGILPEPKKEMWADEPHDQINAPLVNVDTSPHLNVPECRDCPYCGRPI